MITIVHESHKTTLSNNSLIVIHNATEEDYFNLANEDLKVEFDGVCLYIHSPATKKHEKLNHRLISKIDKYLTDNPKIGEVIGSRFALKLLNGKRPEPDVIIVPPKAVNDDDSVYEGVPLMVIEITSPSTRTHDLTVKLNWYKESKVPEILIIDVEEKKFLSYIYNKAEDSYSEKTLTSGIYKPKMLPNFSIDVLDFV
jgi:Uma2 family endonuclease